MSEPFQIGEERPDDHAAIHRIIAAAFGQADEADLVDALRRDGDLLLSLVARSDAHVVGHIALSRLYVLTERTRYGAVALAPIGVHPDHQHKGIGAALITDAHNRLIDRGEGLAVVLGDPAYYSRFGYTAERAAGLTCPWSGPELQALAWSAAAPKAGALHYARAFSDL